MKRPMQDTTQRSIPTHNTIQYSNQPRNTTQRSIPLGERLKRLEPSLAQYLGTQDLEKKYGSNITIAKLLYETAQYNGVPQHQLAHVVANALPVLKGFEDKINEWARQCGW